ncbi:MAG: hypothetical protein QS721_06525 [Candidatus Endonucleobacter sp. (ex Gigantidas childressi)]|nr:hypothetical protein [Candidatus Endonucleobacter sp. (ex Gigantidas childressi)]
MTALTHPKSPTTNRLMGLRSFVSYLHLNGTDCMLINIGNLRVMPLVLT